MAEATEQCLFCNKPKQKIIYSSKLLFVVRDSYPVTKHHTLIIPHRHVSNFFDLNSDELIDLNQILKNQRKSLLNLDKKIPDLKSKFPLNCDLKFSSLISLFCFFQKFF